MEWLWLARRPRSPLLRNFSNGSVGTARDIAHNPIEKKSGIFLITLPTLLKLALLRLIVQGGKLLGVVVWHDDIESVESVHLMGQKVCPFVIGIICKNKPSWDAWIWKFFCSDVTVYNELQSLGRLAARCRTHIKDRVVRLNIAKHRRHHAYDLLPRYDASILSLIHQLVNPFQALVLSQQFFRKHHLEHKVLRIKRFAVHLELTKIDYLRF